MGKTIDEPAPTVKDYVESAYLHGLSVENLDTGELEPPRDISEVEWITARIEALIQQEVTKGKLEELDLMHEKSFGWKRNKQLISGFVEDYHERRSELQHQLNNKDSK